MTDYNDGKWHGWNGGECPVHDGSVVEVVHQYDSDTVLTGEDRAGRLDWCVDARPRVIAFRVTKVHREPREFWVNVCENGTTTTYKARENAIEFGGHSWETIHVREVTEE